MPFNLSFFLTLSAIMWFAYGVFIKDLCVAVSCCFLVWDTFFSTFTSIIFLTCFHVNRQLPNVLGFILGMLQMLLYAIYRNTEKVIEGKKLPEQIETIVVLSTLGVSEVYPVAIDTNTNNTKEDKKQNEQTGEPDKTNHKSLEDSSDLHLDECPV